MAQKGIVKNTVAASQVSAGDFAAIFNAMHGSGIVEYRNNLTTTKVNDNTIRMQSGMYSLSGFMLHIEAGTTVDLTVDSGTLGMSRIDLLVATYQKNGVSEGTDILCFEIIKGTPAATNPVAPTIIQGDINASDPKRQEIIYQLSIVNTTLTVGTKVAKTIMPLRA